MIGRIVLSICVGAVTALLILLLGLVLVAVHVAIATTIGSFLEQWCWVFGFIAAAWFFFTGKTSLSL